MRKKVVILSIVLLFFVSLLSVTSALPNGTETPLTIQPTCAYQSAPAIFGDKIVWEDVRDPSLSQIYSYDLISGEEHPLNASLKVQYNPAIYGNTVVWAEPDKAGDSSKIVEYNTASLNRNEYNGYYDVGTYSGTLEYNYPKISGTTIVWQDYNVTSSNWDISVVRNTGSLPEHIVYGEGDQKHPEIYQNTIVYENWTGGAYNTPSHIWQYNLSNDTAVPISEGFYQETFPHIYGKKIVWEASNLTGDGTHIHLFDQGALTRLTPLHDNPFDQFHPAIYGNRVVVEDYRRSASADIYLYDLLNGTETWVAPNNLSGSQMNPDIYDSRIVWADSRAGQDLDIFLFTLGPAVVCPAAGFLATPAFGSPGLSVTFTDTTQGSPVLYHTWNFGDGYPWSFNPVVPVTHQFVSAGIYPVQLTVGNTLCRNSSPDICKYKIYIDAPPEADFSATPLNGFNPLTVHFTDTSCGAPKSWTWDFGDGTTSTEQNPVHVYTQPGVMYTVSLTVNNSLGNGATNTKTQTGYIRTLIGAKKISRLPVEGITTDQRYHTPFLVYNGSLLNSYHADTGWTFIASEPPEEYGWQNITFVSSDLTGFKKLADQTIMGNFSAVYFHTSDLTETTITPHTGVNYKFRDTNYPARSTITSEMWEGALPSDRATFEYFASLIPPTGYTTVSTIPFTAHITKNPPFGKENAIITMSISSSWYDSLQVTPTTPVIIIGTGKDSAGNTIGAGLRPSRYREGDIDYFVADTPVSLTSFGLAQVSGSGNPFQLITLTITSHIASGGGGGGGSTPVVVQNTATPELKAPQPPDPGKTAKIYSNIQGVITQATTLQSTDGLATVTVSEGIVAKDSTGMALSSITIKAIPADGMPTLPADPAFAFNGMAYELQPDSATFSPEISISYTVPQARWGQDFLVKTFDHASGTWQDVPTKYNPNTGVVTAQVSHFCCFALFTKAVTPSLSLTPIHAQAPPQMEAPPPPTAMSIFSGMILWIINMVTKNVLVEAGVVILGVTLFLYGRKRRRDRVMYLH